MALQSLKDSSTEPDEGDSEAAVSAEGVSAEGGQPLTAADYAAIRAAAEAEGYSPTFADLLCRFAELMGVEQVLLELSQLKGMFKE